MTKKDYIKIAKILNDSVIGSKSHEDKLIGDTECYTTMWIANELAKVMQEDNANFDKYKFMTACGFGEEDIK